MLLRCYNSIKKIINQVVALSIVDNIV